VVVGWVGGIGRLRNEPVLSHQCSILYTAQKMRLSALQIVSISSLASGGLWSQIQLALCPYILRWRWRTKSLDPLCLPQAPTSRNDRGGEIFRLPFPFPFLSSIPYPPLSPPVLPALPLSPLPPLSFPSFLFHFHSLVLPLPFKSRWWVWGSTVSSPSGSGRNPAAKRFWCIFRLKSAHLFQFHNDRFY